MDVPSREQIFSLDDCAEIPVIIPQWQATDGTNRGVYVRALRFRDCLTAERNATRRLKDGTVEVDPWRLVAEEVAAAVTRPNGITVDVILGWNRNVVEQIHNAILSVGGLSGALIAQELARIAGSAPPPQPRDLAGYPDHDAPGMGEDVEPEGGDAAHHTA